MNGRKVRIRRCSRSGKRLLVAGALLLRSVPGDAAPVKHLCGVIEPNPTELAATIERSERQALLLADHGIDRIHLLVQFDGVPGGARRQALEREGVRFGGYLPENAWVVSVPVSSVAGLAARGDVSWVQPWSADLKLHPRVVSGSWSPWSLDPEVPGRVVVFVQLHRDVALERGAVLAASQGGTAFEPVKGLHGVPVLIEASAIPSLATEEDVLWIEEIPSPLTHTNDGALAEARADVLIDPPYQLTGLGVNLFVYDDGSVRETHETFQLPPHPDRVLCFVDQSNECHAGDNHPTHVAGTAAGDGSGSDGFRGRGVAPSAQILSGPVSFYGGELFWNDPGWLEGVYWEARRDYGADLANNSIGSNIAQNWYYCDHEGDYGLGSELIDNLARGENTDVDGPVLMVWANGNERTGTASGSSIRGRCGSNFHTTGPPACAKNSIQVGATNSDGGSMTRFSSWGPCDDGRLKPVITAPGCETGRVGESGIYSSLATGDSDYGIYCGTSMAAPMVSGILSLFFEDWRDLGYGGPDDRPLPALAKAMVIHTARDQGTDGPDYMYGFGEVDATALIDLLRHDSPGKSYWETDSLANFDCRVKSVYVPPGSSELKATLVWDDPAAAAYAATALVNDLDLFLEAPFGLIHRPWVLDPNDPMAAATKGVNTIDNQEQVVVENPGFGIWKRWVCGMHIVGRPQTLGIVTTVTPQTYVEDSCTQLIDNGGFGSGTAGWSLDGAWRELCPANLPGQTRYCLAFGGASSDVDQAWTNVTIPAGVGRAELRGDWFMSTTEGLDGHNYDHFRIEVRSGGLIHLIQAVVDERWDGYPEQHLLSPTRLPIQNIDLTPWAGREVNIAFRSETNEVYPTTFWIDNLSLEVCLGTAIFVDGFESGNADRWSSTTP